MAKKSSRSPHCSRNLPAFPKAPERVPKSDIKLVRSQVKKMTKHLKAFAAKTKKGVINEVRKAKTPAAKAEVINVTATVFERGMKCLLSDNKKILVPLAKKYRSQHKKQYGSN